MNELDSELKQLAALIDDLPRRSQVALFWAASSAHLESASSWAYGHSEMSGLLQRAQEASYAFCFGDDLSVDRAGVLVDELDQPHPENVGAQSSWICADAALRIIIDSTFESGMSIEYALEPVLGRTSEELFGFWQVGSGEAEDDQVAEIMTQPDVARAVDFCRWAIHRLAAPDAPSAASLEEIRTSAAVLSGE